MEHEEMRATVYAFPRAFPFCEIKKEREKILEKGEHEREKKIAGQYERVRKDAIRERTPR